MKKDLGWGNRVTGGVLKRGLVCWPLGYNEGGGGGEQSEMADASRSWWALRPSRLY